MEYKGSCHIFDLSGYVQLTICIYFQDKMSWPGDETKLNGTILLRLYLNEEVGLGPGPRLRGGAVTEEGPQFLAPLILNPDHDMRC
jgi:hypothetical protein